MASACLILNLTTTMTTIIYRFGEEFSALACNHDMEDQITALLETLEDRTRPIVDCQRPTLEKIRRCKLKMSYPEYQEEVLRVAREITMDGVPFASVVPISVTIAFLKLQDEPQAKRPLSSYIPGESFSILGNTVVLKDEMAAIALKEAYDWPEIVQLSPSMGFICNPRWTSVRLYT